MSLIWSPEQHDIFTWFRTSRVRSVVVKNVVVEANAGCAKTSTSVEGLMVHAPETYMLYGVFNTRNKKEAEEKIRDRQRIEIRTWHSLGFYFIKKIWKDAKPDEMIEFDRIQKVLSPLDRSDRQLVGLIAKLVGFVKNTFINPSQDDIYQTAIEREIIEESIGGTQQSSLIVTSCAKVFELSKQQDSQNRISFDDMVWLPCALGIVTPKFPLVLADEYQDLNAPQIEMVKRSCLPDGRIIVVGDSRQAIYSWRGSVQNAMQKARTELDAAVLTLSTTYRCPRLVVEKAKEIVPGYKAAPQAPEGEILYAKDAAGTAQVGDAILSRLNAPLMPLALGFLRKNAPARIEGKDIGRQLLARVRSFKATSVPNFLERVTAWEKKEIARLEKTKNPDKKIEQTIDIADTLKSLAMDAKSISDIDNRINLLFDDTKDGSRPCILLSTVHRAKGLEWHRVLLLQSTFRNGKGIQEEENIFYVALTRTKHTLIFISDAPSGAYSKPHLSLPSQITTTQLEVEGVNSSEGEFAVPVKVKGKTSCPPRKKHKTKTKELTAA